MFMGHCNREMYHAQWSILLDDEFLEPTDMEWQLSVVMACGAVFTCVYSLILQITRRSEYSPPC